MSVILGNGIALLMVAVLVGLSAREILKSHKSGGCAGCSGSCASCGRCAGAKTGKTGDCGCRKKAL